MLRVLLEISFTENQVKEFEHGRKEIERKKTHPPAPPYIEYEYQAVCFEEMIGIRFLYLLDLWALKIEYTRLAIMWEFECSKVEVKWDINFIWRRRPELAQLNRRTHKLAMAFGEKLRELLTNGLSLLWAK